MNSIVNYGSDDNSDDSGDEKVPVMHGREKNASSKNYRKTGGQEDNYEEVGMDMSEDSNDSAQHAPVKKQSDERRGSKDRKDGKSHRSSVDRSVSKSPKYRREDDDRRSRGDERYQSRRDDRRYSRDLKDDEKKSDRTYRDEDKGRDRDRYRDDRRDRRDDRSSREDKYGRDRRDRRRSRSRDRRRSKSPRSSRSPKRSRSNSRDRGPPKGFRRDRASNRMDRLDKLGIEFKPDNYPASALQGNGDGGSGDRFFMPGITGRFRDQIEKRKQLWQKPKDQDPIPISRPGPSNGLLLAGSKAAKVYEATTFADDKTSCKFKRLMGIRNTGPANLPTKSSDVLKKQEEMFSSMEAQYEVARTATHTMRGVGLGFGSFQR